MKTLQKPTHTRVRAGISANPFRQVIVAALALAGLAAVSASPVQAQYNDPYYESSRSAAYGYDRGNRARYRRSGKRRSGKRRSWRNRYTRNRSAYGYRSRYRDRYSYGYRDDYARRASQRARRAAAQRAFRDEIRRAARRAEKRRYTLGSPSLVIRLNKPGAAKIRQTGKIYVAPPVAPGPLGRFLYDRTLRRGDVVTTPRGLMVFAGVAGTSKHSSRDFQPLRRASRITGKKLAGQLRSIDKANRKAQRNPVLRQTGKTYKKTASSTELPFKSANRL